MKPKDYFIKEYGIGHIEMVCEMKDYTSLYSLMEEYSEQAGINTNVVRPSVECADGGGLLATEAEAHGVSADIKMKECFWYNEQACTCLTECDQADRV